ncbi:uncharacterized protein LOC124904200 [Homo sapiens]|uniref:uncharacterized protein LOC124904200 n=1 Tax=Homo sapiens TaxID=9606 RepID=UPI001FB04DD4|nr:uncharacterized protein LOC124904200 [Homo sapiens]
MGDVHVRETEKGRKRRRKGRGKGKRKEENELQLRKWKSEKRFQIPGDGVPVLLSAVSVSCFLMSFVIFDHKHIFNKNVAEMTLHHFQDWPYETPNFCFHYLESSLLEASHRVRSITNWRPLCGGEAHAVYI